MSGVPGRGGVMSRDKLYAVAAQYAPRAIEVLQELMDEQYQPSVRVSAAKTLLAKALPDIKAMEISGKDGEPLKVLFVPAEVMAKYQIENKKDALSASAIDAEIAPEATLDATITTIDALSSNTSTSSE